MCKHIFMNLNFFSCCATYNSSFIRKAELTPMVLLLIDEPVHVVLGRDVCRCLSNVLVISLFFATSSFLIGIFLSDMQA